MEPQRPAYTTATAMLDFNPLSEARDLTCILMDTSQLLNPLSYNGNSQMTIFDYITIT